MIQIRIEFNPNSEDFAGVDIKEARQVARSATGTPFPEYIGAEVIGDSWHIIAGETHLISMERPSDYLSDEINWFRVGQSKNYIAVAPTGALVILYFKK